MYLCTCKSVSDDQIRRAVEQGARGFGDLSVGLGVGIECGKCIDGVNALLRECLAVVTPPPASTETAPNPVPPTVAPAPVVPKENVPAHAWFAIDL